MKHRPEPWSSRGLTHGDPEQPALLEPRKPLRQPQVMAIMKNDGKLMDVYHTECLHWYMGLRMLR